jgi:serine/threonine protein kinase
MSTNQFPQPFGKYILLNKIALGGMAEIFRAKTIGAEGFEKEVVIKRILPHYTEDEAFVTMFIDEAKVSSGLNHPNIVQIYDFDIEDGCYYIAMEYIEGRDLRRVIDVGVERDNPLTAGQIVNLTMDVAKGLHYAHTKTSKGEPLNIIHRDVSPQNVMISFDGEVKIMDFGIAKAAARSTKTRAGMVKGKCAYMSPEQARGKDLDPRSDLFAVGIMTWEMLTGRRLFAGDSDFATLTNVLKAEVPPTQSINTEVPEALDQIILKCLSREREDRHTDCKDFLRDLENWYYPNVEDKESAELGSYMNEMFADDIVQLRETHANDAETQFIEASNEVRRQRSESSSGMHSASSNPSVEQMSGIDLDSTIALDLAATDFQPSSVDSSENPTVALAAPDLSAQAPSTPAQAKSGSKTGLILTLLAVIIALGVGGFFAWPHLSSKKENETNTTAKQSAQITFRVTPSDATITVEDRSETGELTLDTFIGEEVEAGFEKAGYTPRDRTVEVKKAKQTFKVRLRKEKPETPKEVLITFRATPPSATIEVLGKSGTGTLKVQATVGDQGEAVFNHPDYLQKVKAFSIRRDGQTVSVVLEKKPEPVDQTVIFEAIVVPPEAALFVNEQPQPPTTPGNYSVRGYAIGDDVRISVKLEGHLTVKETIKLTTSRYRKEYTLKPKPKEPTGPGFASFNAKPWAKVSVRGKSCTTPCKLKLQSGRYRAKFKQGSKSKSRGFTVKAGKTARVFVDMTR